MSVPWSDISDAGFYTYTDEDHADPISEAVYRNDKRLLLQILKERKKERLPLSANDEGWTALHIAAYRPKYKKCLELLLLYGDSILININNITRKGRTALHIACANNCVAAVSCLLEFGAKAKIWHYYMTVALHYAILNGRTEILHLLLQSADINRIEDYGLYNIRAKDQEYAYLSITCCAIRSGNPECLVALMTSKLPQTILRIPSIINLCRPQVLSPLAYVFYFSDKIKSEQLDSILHLLFQCEVKVPDRFSEGPRWQPDLAYTLKYCNLFSIIFNDSWSTSKQQHYFDLLIANNITPDYCLQCNYDTSKPFPTLFKEGGRMYTVFYEPVLNAVQRGKIDVVKLLISNSAILEPDDLNVHLWFCVALGGSESSDIMYQYLISLKPSYHQRVYRPPKNFQKYQFPTHSEEFSTATLQQLCRTAIRKQLREPTIEDNLRNFRRKILELPLPSVIKDYLLFKT
ncbi:hypothetical protein V9T40_011249 [Parthenolecanium corni]|uniref:SOCS box domain-containing protein n=1 Tax=Parthenolecanium corni TaxID=536013 RepID=A0AAN9T548_9HEMI